MSAIRQSQNQIQALAGLMTKLVYEEFALMDACHRAAESADGEERAILAHRVGTAQRHIFDLESLLRDIGKNAVSYSGCVRRTLSSLRVPAPDSILGSLKSGYRRALGRRDLPTPVQQLLVENLGEYGEVLPSTSEAVEPEPMRMAG